MRVISLGWGVQSFTLAAMVALGELEPIDAAIHADTTHDSVLTYKFAEKWTAWLEEYGVKVITVKADDTDVIDQKYNHTQIPLYDNQGGMGKRQCTTHWKITPVRRKIRELSGGKPVEQWIGISLDEIQRANSSGVKYVTNRFPLVEKRMRRSDCVVWLENNGLEIPPKSACVFCPYHGLKEWRKTKAVDEDWQEAIRIDEEIRHVSNNGLTNYLTNKRVPLVDLDLSTPEERGQINWIDECSGTCWL